MKRSMLIIIVVVVIGGGITMWKSLNNKKSANVTNNTSKYQAERSETNQNIKNHSTTNNINDIANSVNITNSEQNQIQVVKKESEISQFTTKIYNKKSERQNNITITCKAITAKEVGPGETFSFCDTVGKATSAKGYKEADIYVNGEKKRGLGGGNCQVSTTLYNAVLKVPELEVIERHQHSGNVPYIQDGKDAAVAYGTYDFKFKNNTSNVIKIIMENTKDNIIAKLIKLE